MSKIIGIVIVVVIAIGTILFIYNDVNKVNDNTKGLVIDNIATSTEDILIDIKNDSNMPDIVVNTEPKAPDLDKIIIFYNNNLTEDTKTLLSEKITKSRSNLKENNDLFSEWLSLGVNYKIAGDFQSAKDVWEYASVIRPFNDVSFANLGDLYHYYLKDFPKAEQNFRKAIENGKDNVGAYIALHELYKYSYKQDTTLVTDVLLEGLAENPNNIDLLITLAAYYKETGDTTNAKKYYEQARDEAQNLGNTHLVDLLNQELTELINL